MFWLAIVTSVDQGPGSKLSQACRKTAPSVSEAGTGAVMPAPFPSTAVSQSSSVETWVSMQKISDVF